MLTSNPEGVDLKLRSAYPSLAVSYDKPDALQEGQAQADLPNGPETAAQPPAISRRKRMAYMGLLAVAAITILLVTILVQKPTNAEEYVKSAGYTGVFLMGIMGSAAPVWPLPGSWAAFIAAGLGLNPIFIGLAAGFGEPIGEIAYYLLGYGGVSQLPTQRWKWYARIQNWMRRWGGPTIFLVSAIPNFFVRLATTAAGSLHYPLWKFFLFCWAGKTIKSFAFAFAGAGLFDGIRNWLGW